MKNLNQSNKKYLLLGETTESTSLQLSTASKSVNSTVAQLMTAASEGNEAITSRAARDTANALRDFTAAVRGVAATTKDQGFHNKIINSAHLVMEKSAMLGMFSHKKSIITIFGHKHFQHSLCHKIFNSSQKNFNGL